MGGKKKPAGVQESSRKTKQKSQKVSNTATVKNLQNRGSGHDKENEPEEVNRRSTRQQVKALDIHTKVVRDKAQLEALRQRQVQQKAQKQCIDDRGTNVRKATAVSQEDEEDDDDDDDGEGEGEGEQQIGPINMDSSDNDSNEDCSSSEDSSEQGLHQTMPTRKSRKFNNHASSESSAEFGVDNSVTTSHHNHSKRTPVFATNNANITTSPHSSITSLKRQHNQNEERGWEIVTRKRTCYVSNSSEEDAEMGPELESTFEDNGKKKDVHLTSKHRQRGTLGDFKDPNVRKTTKRASTEYMVRISTVSAFPDDNEEDFFARECWDNACEHQGIVHPFTDHIKGLITRNASTIRGRVKDIAVASVASYFRFRRSIEPEAIQFNKDLAASLLKDHGFAYKDREEGTGLYENEIIAEIILVQWFKNKNSDGILFGASFNPISIPTLALVLTAVEYAIEQWSSGTYKRTADFSEAQVLEIYNRHVEALHAWRTYNITSGQALAHRQQELYIMGRGNAGLPILEPGITPCDSQKSYKSKFERAAKALEEANQ